MKVVILAGGFGSRISEESHLKPKPMVEIGTKPIIWHVMKGYAAHGITQFVICTGYKGFIIKEYFANYFLHNSDVTFDMRNNQIEFHHQYAEPWRVTVVDTGESTMTGGRLRRVKEHVDGQTFCFTYGDGVSNVNLTKLVAEHQQNNATNGSLATVTVVQPPGRFGSVTLKGNTVSRFHEKPKGDGAWVNGGFFVLEPEVFGLIKDDRTTWEQEPLCTLADSGQLAAHQHGGFWYAMDTMRDRQYLEELWATGNAPWKSWE